MDNGPTSPAASSGSRAGTKPRPSDEPAALTDESTSTAGNGSAAPAANGNGHGNGNGNGRGRRKRPPATKGMVGDPLAGGSVAATPADDSVQAPVEDPVGPASNGSPRSSATAEAPTVETSPADSEAPQPLPPRADDGGPPFTNGKPLGRFRAKRSAKPAVDDAAAAAATISPPAGATPLSAVPLVGPPEPGTAAKAAPVVTRVAPTPPVTPLPIVVPLGDEPTGELVARKVTAPPVTMPLDVPVEPQPQTAESTVVVPLGRRPGRPSVTFQRRRTRPRVRRVTRVLRHVDTWSVFKVAVVFNAFLYAVMLTAGVLLWHVAFATGTIDNVERFFEGFGWESFQFKGGEIFHNAWIGGLFVAVGLTGLAVLLATLFNLITDLVGGVRVSVLEEEVLARADRTARMVVEDDPDSDAPYDQARSG